jgi:hypothetical protein
MLPRKFVVKIERLGPANGTVQQVGKAAAITPNAVTATVIKPKEREDNHAS